MSTVHEIETAVSKLSRHELLAFREWFFKFDAAAERNIEGQVARGSQEKFDRVLAKVPDVEPEEHDLQ